MAGRKRALFKEKYPELLKFFTKPLELENITIGDQRKFEVKCAKGHRKPILLKTLIKEKRVPCGYCSGRLVYKVSEEQKNVSLGLIAGELDNLRNDFWFTHPQLAENLVNPEEGFLTGPNSTKALAFICERQHILKVKVNTKTSLNPDCGYCVRKRLWPVSDEQLRYSIDGELGLIDPRRNDYLASHPEIIEFLVNPEEALVISSNTIVEVYCEKKLHKNFKALSKIHQCGYCDGKKIFELSKEDIDIILNGDNSHLFEQRNDLYKYYPKQSLLLKDVRQAFKVTRNQKVDLDCVCSKNHKWTVHSTAYIRSGCSQCSLFSYSPPKIKFSEKYPELLQHWDYENNASSPFEISVKREDKFYWICARCGDSFERCVRNQFESVGKNCKSCELKDAAEFRRIATLDRIGRLSDKYPELAKEYSEFNEVTLDRIHIKTYYRAKWECSACDYSWFSLVEVRVNGGGKCPKCSGRVLIKGVNDLATLAPHLVKDWDEDYDPSEVKANSSKMARWRCSKCGYRWLTSIKNRSKGGNGCLECFKTSKRSKGHQSVSDFVESLGYSVINDARPFKNSRLEVDIFIPELSIGLEYNGDYWHSDRVTKSRWGVKAKEKHHEKLLKAEESGIALAYIWESDWQNSEEIIKNAINVLLEENIMKSILRKLSSIESESMVEDLKLAIRESSDYVKPLRNLSEDQYEVFKERYLSGETPASIGEDLNFNIHNLYKLIRENNLVQERLRLGISKNGSKTIPLHLCEEFKKDFLVLSKAALLEKYKINNVSLMKLVTRLGLVSKTHYKSLKN